MASKSVRYIVLTAAGPLSATNDESGRPLPVSSGEAAPTFTEKQAQERARAYSHPGTKGRPARTIVQAVK
jgi:hypothetical protein